MIPIPEEARMHKSISFSQCGEDLIVDYIFKLRNIYNPTYIDIGAYHPYRLNNTAIFYHRGCKGINIEANPWLLESFKELRPNDINLNVGISDYKGKLNFYFMYENTLSTFSKKEMEIMVKLNKQVAHIAKIKVTTINSIIEKYTKNIFPDFLSLDAEGFDLKILQSINFLGNVPKVICVESAEYSPLGAGAPRNELIDFLESKGYYRYACTNLNSIMVKRDFWFS